MSTIKVDKLQGTSGSSTAMTLNGATTTFNSNFEGAVGVKLTIDTLEGKDNAGQIVVKSEGGAAFTQLQQGLCKQWANWDGATTVADSFNTTSATDNASGDSTMTIATAMVSINFTVGGLSKSNDNGGVRFAAMQFPANATAIPSTTTYRIHTQYENAGLRDAELQTVHIFGDLA